LSSYLNHKFQIAVSTLFISCILAELNHLGNPVQATYYTPYRDKIQGESKKSYAFIYKGKLQRSSIQLFNHTC